MSTRRSSRLTAKAKEVVISPTQLSQKEKPLQKKRRNLVAPNEDTSKTSKRAQGSRNLKKQKISDEKDASSSNTVTLQSNRGRVKGKSANPGVMKDIPFDILVEIFCLLEPLDLLHLSRVSKSLHDLLTSDDLAFLWKRTYKDIRGTPICPDEMNAVFFTNYLYHRHCQFCSSGLGRVYHETAFIRLCSKCANINFLSLGDLDPSVRQLCNKWLLKSEYVVLKAEYDLRLEEFKHAQKTRGVQSYVKERERVLRIRSSVGHSIAQWRKRMHRAHLENMRAIRYKRANHIMNRLEAEFISNQTFDSPILGTKSKADWNMVKYRVHQAPHVRKSRDLTDSEWQLIRADILDFLQDFSENRAIIDLRYRLEGHISHLGTFITRWKIRPTAWWIASSSEPIAAFLKSLSLKNTSQSSDFAKVEPQLRDVITSWKEEIDCYLATLVPQPSGKRRKQGIRDGENNALELATTFFKCHWCTEPISYPRILMHGCFLNDAKPKEEARDEETDEADVDDSEGDVVVNTRGPREPRAPRDITPDLVFPMLSDGYTLGIHAGHDGVMYDVEASGAIREIITAYGEDPMTVTYAAMEENPVRLECLRCNRVMQAKKTKAVRLVMKWTMALVHELEDHYGEPPSSEPAWGKIDSFAELARVEEAEIKIKKQKRFQEYFRYGVPAPPLDTPIKMLNPAVKI